MEPINYNLQPLNIIGSYAQGLQSGQVAQQNDLKLKAQQLAAEQAAKQQAEMDAIKAVATNPKATYAEMADAGKRLLFLDPAKAQQLNELTKSAKAEELQTLRNHLHGAYYGIANGTIQPVMQSNEDLAQRLEDSGDMEGADSLRELNKKIARNPQGAGIEIASQLYGLGDEKFISSMTPDAATQAEIDLKKAQAEKAQAEAGAVQDKLAIEKEANRIAQLRVDAANATNEVKKRALEAQADLSERKLNDAKLKSNTDYVNAKTGLSESKNLLGKILGDEDTLRSAVGASGLLASMPGSKARSMVGWIEQLQNSIAAVNLDKLKGAMSDKDIQFLRNIGSNLDRYQDEDEFISELNRIYKSFDNAEKTLQSKYLAPSDQQQSAPSAPIEVDF